MLARHAENLFWAGRYAVRAEDTSRLLDVTFHWSLQARGRTESELWQAVLEVLRLDAGFTEIADKRPVPVVVLSDRELPGSIVHAVSSMREALRAVREQVPIELWEEANDFHLDLTRRDLAQEVTAEPSAVLAMVRRRCQTLTGIADSNMVRDDGRAFFRLGGLLERALMSCRLLASQHEAIEVGSHGEVALALRAASGLQAFRRTFGFATGIAPVATFLVLSRDFPRSVLFNLAAAESLLDGLGGPRSDRTRSQRTIGRIRAELDFLEPAELVEDLPNALARYEDGVRHIAEVIATDYFRSAAEVSQHSQFLLPAHGG